MLDVNNRYWQVKIAEKDCEKTEFTSHHGLFRFTRMHFEFKNAPWTFQRVIDVLLKKVKWKVDLINLEDIVIFSRTNDERID